MDDKEKMLELMKAAGEPMSARSIIEMAALNAIDKTTAEKLMDEMKKDGSIVSRIRCKWEPAE